MPLAGGGSSLPPVGAGSFHASGCSCRLGGGAAMVGKGHGVCPRV